MFDALPAASSKASNTWLGLCVNTLWYSAISFTFSSAKPARLASFEEVAREIPTIFCCYGCIIGTPLRIYNMEPTIRATKKHCGFCFDTLFAHLHNQPMPEYPSTLPSAKLPLFVTWKK